MAMKLPANGAIGSQAYWDAQPPEVQHSKAFRDYYGLGDAKWNDQAGKWIQTSTDVGDNAGAFFSYINAPAYDPNWVKPGSTPTPAPEPEPVNPAVEATRIPDAGTPPTQTGEPAPSRYEQESQQREPAKTSLKTSGMPSFENSGFNLKSWEATMGSVDPATETVRGQLQTLLDEGSPYLDLARQKSMETSNARGLLNSSIAAGAGERAAIEAALPIANADAQLYMQQSLTNQQYQNQAGQFNADQYNQMSRIGYQSMLQDILNANQMSRQTQSQMELMELDEDIKTRLTALQQDYAVELETLKQSYNIMQNRDTQMGTMYADATKSIAGFLNRAELTPQQQSAGVKVIIDTLNSGLQFMSGISGPNVANNYQSSTSYVPPTG